MVRRHTPSRILPSETAARRRPRRSAFPYYGGKFVHLNFLLPARCRHFCEPFGGSAAVLLNRPPAPIETYNDLDSEAVNFFACLRNHPRSLVRLLRHTPYGREELQTACLPSKGVAPVERARRFFIRAHQTFNARAQTGAATQWSYARETSRRGMSALVSKWLGGIAGLPDVAERLRRVQLEHAPAVEVIRRYDSPDTLFYCDPPYPHESRRSLDAYTYEMSDRDHEALADALRAA